MACMIVVHAYLRSKPERRAETVEALVAAQQATVANDGGCVHYAFVADLEDDCAFTCVEEWRDVESLTAHLTAPHMATLDTVLAETAEGPAELRIFSATPAVLPH